MTLISRFQQASGTDPTDVFASAGAVAAAVRAGRLSAREVTGALLARIASINPQMNAISEVDADGAAADADRVDEAIARGEATGPLAGVPMTVKDAFHVTGLRTTWGSPDYAEAVADRDATVVERLRRAGAVIAGKSNVALMLGDFGQTSNPLHGTTNNPWNLGYATGGSSGGAAAALAAGMTHLEYGSDLVGSIRIPAAYCGVYGLKPTTGTVPLSGFQPPGPRAPTTATAFQACVGPMARTAGDLRLALRATGGPENPEALTNDWRLAPPRRRRLGEFTAGAVLDDPACPVTTEVGDLLSDGVDALAAAGVTIRHGWPVGIDPGRVAESFGVHVRAYLAFFEPGGSLDGLDYLSHERTLLAVRAAWADYFRGVDVFLCPVTFTTAFPHDSRPFDDRTIETPEGTRPYFDQPFWVTQASLPGLPALTAPAGRTVAGLPVGLQVIGPRHEDDTAITFAEQMAETIGGFSPPPL